MTKSEAKERVNELQDKVVELNEAGALAKPKLAIICLFRVVILINAIIEGLDDAATSEQ